jgi:energy-coupling factor transporter transmembrane protein EcfT
MKKKNLFLRYFGLIILAVGIIFNILMFVYKAWPTYLFLIFCIVGILQICFSFIDKRIKIGWQIFWSILPLLLLYIIIQIDSSSKDIFLIPKGFHGEVQIQYGIKNGREKESEGFWRIYTIPKDGKLETQYKLKGESIDLSGAQYYYVDEKGNREVTNTYCEYCKVKDTVSTQIIWGILGGNENGNYQTFYVEIPNKKYFKLKKLEIKK